MVTSTLRCLKILYSSQALYEKLMEERLVPDDLDDSPDLTTTSNNTFTVDFSGPGPYFSVITKQGMETLR